MKPPLRALALGVGPAMVAAGVGVLAQGQPPPRLASPPPVTAASCKQPPVFIPVYPSDQDAVQPRDEGFHFGGVSMLEGRLCSAGTLKITATGDVAGGEEPQLTVFFNGELLAAPRFNQERTVELQLPNGGPLFLGFFNDYYETDSRVVFLREMKLFGQGCQDFLMPRYEQGKGIEVNLGTHTALLASGLPLTFTPCRDGEWQFRLLGRKGQKALPILQITQGNHVLYKRPVDTEWKAVRLDVQRQPLTLQLLNPYWKTLGDRNLDIKRIKFIPEPSAAQRP